MSVVSIVKAAIIAVVTSVACLLPPGVHFVTGPLAPAIGGYVAGMKARLNTGEALVLGLIFTALGASAPFLITMFGSINFSQMTLIFFAVVAAIYFGGLGTVAAVLGGNSAREEKTSEQASEDA